MSGQITVFSPHRDDAVFSVFLSLSCWSRLDLRLRVVNFFTYSAYGPHTLAAGANQISAIRKREDRKALARISPGITIADCDLLDAPIRLNISERDISSPETHALLTEDQIDDVAKRMRAIRRDSLFLAPLALGNHVDHLAVRAAAMRCIPAHKLAFYEDLPYATWIPKEEFEARISEAQHVMRIRLKPALVRSRHALSRKRSAAILYQSQITREEGVTIAGWATKYGGAERIWAPASGRAWCSLFERSNAAFCE